MTRVESATASSSTCIVTEERTLAMRSGHHPRDYESHMEGGRAMRGYVGILPGLVVLGLLGTTPITTPASSGGRSSVGSRTIRANYPAMAGKQSHIRPTQQRLEPDPAEYARQKAEAERATGSPIVSKVASPQSPTTTRNWAGVRDAT